MDKTLFSLRDFSKPGGGSLRIKGLINAISKTNDQAVLICSENQREITIPAKLIKLDLAFKPIEKKIFLFLLSNQKTHLILDILFYKKIKKISLLIKENNLANKTILFCEYIDNSIGYYLKQKKIISSYTIDIHGIAHLEFPLSQGRNIFKRLYYSLKSSSSINLDRMVFENADLIVYSSKAMQQYFSKIYPKISKNKHVIIPNCLDDHSLSDKKINAELLDSIYSKYKFDDKSEIIFFAGGFKKSGGITDLIHAFSRIVEKRPNAMLFILGHGPLKKQLSSLVDTYNLKKKVIFGGIIPYHELYTYQSIASTIVCPDTDNPFSNMIIHLKYFDSLVSGKVVINGNFASVLEVNKDERLSVNFLPSNIDNLTDRINYVLKNKIALEHRYKDNLNYVLNHLTYDKYIQQILKIWS